MGESTMQTQVGPRLAGGVYFDAAGGRTYRVEAVYRGEEARRVLGDAAGEWALEVVDLDDGAGRVRVDRTPWDAGRDCVLVDPAR